MSNRRRIPFVFDERTYSTLEEITQLQPEGERVVITDPKTGKERTLILQSLFTTIPSVPKPEVLVSIKDPVTGEKKEVCLPTIERFSRQKRRLLSLKAVQVEGPVGWVNPVKAAFLRMVQAYKPNYDWHLTPLENGWMAEASRPGQGGRIFCTVRWQKGHPVFWLQGNYWEKGRGAGGFGGRFTPDCFGPNPNRDDR